MPDRLTGLQHRILGALRNVDPPWVLTGGGALAGAHLGHRTTRDLDLFWRGRTAIEHLAGEVRAALVAAGLEVSALQSGSSFHRFRVADEGEVVAVDLVADPVAAIEEPQEVELEGVRVLVDSFHEILVNKLCALVSRSEVRDLVDVRALLAAGGDFHRAMSDAPSKDGGFSPLVLAWCLRQLSLEDADLDAGLLEGLSEFREELVDRVTGGSAPGV